MYCFFIWNFKLYILDLNSKSDTLCFVRYFFRFFLFSKMKNWKTKVFLWVTLFVLVVFGIEIFQEYMANHSYYGSMLSDWSNWKMIFAWLASSFIPLAYLIWHKKFSLRNFMIYLFIWLNLFGLLHVGIKWGSVWSWGSFILIFKTAVLFILGIYFLLWSLSFGSLLTSKFLKFKEIRRQEMLLSFGIWLWVFLFVFRYIIQLNIFFSVVVWIVFVGLGVMIYFQKKQLWEYKSIVSDILSSFHKKYLKENAWKYIWIILIVIIIVYYFYWFQLSFIPYSTAWDANHAYMYLPKIWSLNNWVIWTGNTMAPSSVWLWHTFIAFWFSLMKPLSGILLAPDTVAVSMNFLSAILVFFFGLWLVKEVTDYMSIKSETKWAITSRNLAFYVWWFVLLLRLTSGMWAFLVFVDNKTDLWLMALTILALLSWFIFISQIVKSHSASKLLNKESLKYIGISWFFFALAALAKPTAFTDIILFGLLLVGLWFSWVFVLWGWIFVIGLMGKLQFWNIKDFISPDSPVSMYLLVLWAIFIGLWILHSLYKLKKKPKLNYIPLVKYFSAWVISFFVIFVVAKAPWVIYNMTITENHSFLKDMLWAKTSPIERESLFVQVWSIPEVNDKKILRNTMSPSVCKSQSYSVEELDSTILEAPSSNEDVGRYVWYGWREFQKWNKLFNLSFALLKLRYPDKWVWKCYWWDKEARILCENTWVIDSFDVNWLHNILSMISAESEEATMIEKALENFKDKWASASDPQLAGVMRDDVVKLRGYYQNKIIKSEEWKLFIPYKRLIPFNVVFNRSLQNHSSYYTDIWFVWLIAFVLLIIWLFYSIVRKDQKLLVLTLSTITWWIIWWLIWWGIVWYGIWLIVWTLLVLSMFLKSLYDDSNDSTSKNMFYIVIALLALSGIIQLLLNFARISSQWASWPFTWYKMWIWQELVISDTLQQKQEIKYWYKQKDVFNLQFPHYNKFIDLVKDRPDEDGVLIAGTYLQYFLDNQINLKWDWMLYRFWQATSDDDSCRAYHRLKNENLKYLVIDPNIWTVVMWEWNETLFHRFFAKINPVTKKIESDWSITMLVKLRKDWYLNLISSNNLWAKYAFSLPDSAIKSAFPWYSDDEIRFVRAQLCVSRFFPNSAQLMNFIANTFSLRVRNGLAIWDIADVYGKVVDEQKIASLAQQMLQTTNQSHLQWDIALLTNDERIVLLNYLSLFNLMQNDKKKKKKSVQWLLWQSLGGSSQVMIFEVID